ncbi:zinc-binding dehydrogenase [Streptomyces sp. NBC_00435]|uniref:zinc-binding dehydrogenase n=1 Tax=Streptomyces sp. NBC_00435 TaxID=2903649 RepID=UPI002E1EDE9C
MVEQEVAADGAHLARPVSLVDAGGLALRVAESFPREEAPKGHARLADGGARGRILLTVD